MFFRSRKRLSKSTKTMPVPRFNLQSIALVLVLANRVFAYDQSEQVRDHILPAESPLLKEVSTSSNKSLNYHSNALHRLDFRLQGKSCPVCLLGIQRRLKSISGTVQVAVMLKKPFGASVIYDSKVTNKQALLEAVKEKEPSVQLENVEDKAIAKVPVILLPPHASLSP